ncbi:MAG: replication initiation protein [Salinivenus sp.]
MEQESPVELSAPGGKVVAKANDLVRARHTFSTMEQRIFVAMVAQLDQEAESFSLQSVPVRDVSTEGNESDLYRRIDEITDRLLDRVVEIRTEDEQGQEEGFVKYNVFSRCQYDRGSGVVQAKFTEDMRPFLLQLKEKFTLYLITVFLRLRSKYSTQIYELLKMRQGLRRHRMSVEAFRRTLALEDKYPRFSSVKRRVIEQARTELKEKADIYFTYDVRREGNVPTTIDFYIHENEPVIRELREETGEFDRGRKEAAVGRESSTRAPRLDPKAMFMADLSQEEVDDMDRDRLRALHEEARARAEEENPNTDSEVVLKQRTYALMKARWADERD